MKYLLLVIFLLFAVHVQAQETDFHNIKLKDSILNPMSDSYILDSLQALQSASLLWVSAEDTLENTNNSYHHIPSPIMPLYRDSLMRLEQNNGIGYDVALDSVENPTFRLKPSSVRENSNSYDQYTTESIVVVSEELAIDCVWVTLREYYGIWDSQKVNPYQIDASKFQDTVQLQLFDSLADLQWAFPLDGDSSIVTSEFGMRRHRWHHGIDLDLEIGDPVYAAFDGIVRVSKYGRGFGNIILLRHYNGFETLYAHLTASHVQVGLFVKAGQQIGTGGNTGRSTGPHLHFEMRYQGNSINPRHIYNFDNNTIKKEQFTLKPSHFKHFKQMRQRIYHRIRQGESLWTISRKYRVRISTLCRLNGISTRSVLRVGRRIRVR